MERGSDRQVHVGAKAKQGDRKELQRKRDRFKEREKKEVPKVKKTQKRGNHNEGERNKLCL